MKKSGFHFSDVFGIDKRILAGYGAYNISLLCDIPMFVDPFLLFSSRNGKYLPLHKKINKYMIFLRDLAGIYGKREESKKFRNLLYDYFSFPEPKQNWLGYSKKGNKGRGLGMDFAESLYDNMNTYFRNIGRESISNSSHISKIGLIGKGVGIDKMSDFTTRLILDDIALFTQDFATKHLRKDQVKKVVIKKAYFNFRNKIWEPKEYTLPYDYDKDDFILLTPNDMLSYENSFVSKDDLYKNIQNYIDCIDNQALRDEVNYYYHYLLMEQDVGLEKAVENLIAKYPILLDYYMRDKEEKKENALQFSDQKRRLADEIFVEIVSNFRTELQERHFYDDRATSYKSNYEKAHILKRFIENEEGNRLLFKNGICLINDQGVLQRICTFIWGEIMHEEEIEVKLATNTRLKTELQKSGIKVILAFTEREYSRAQKIINDLNLVDNKNIILINAAMV